MVKFQNAERLENIEDHDPKSIVKTVTINLLYFYLFLSLATILSKCTTREEYKFIKK
jgi:hypothetical protein